MRTEPEQVSSREFVIQGANAGELRQLLKPFGEITLVPGQKETYVLQLGVPDSSARHGWETLQKAIGSEGRVLPVFLNENGEPKYAVGTLQVRFPSVPSDEDLHAWLPAGLRVKSRNEFVPAQIALEPDESGERFLPDVIGELRQQNGEQIKIWPETLQGFRRA